MEPDLQILFQKFLENRCQDQEVLALLENFQLVTKEAELKKLIDQRLDQEGSLYIKAELIDERLDLAYQRLWAGFAEVNRSFVDEQAAKTLKFRKKISVAAAVAAIAVSAWFYTSHHFQIDNMSRDSLSYGGDISPGKQGATLTLANGKKIKLTAQSNGQLANEAEVVISKSADGQLRYTVKGDKAGSHKINTLTTEKGETYKLILPDDSRVWLNAASSLTYAVSLRENGKRKVKLQGEAYFEITKDKAHPFVVESRGQLVEVLGTHFNVNAYRDEMSIKTTLLEGCVQVSSVIRDQQETIVLKPNQESTFTDAGNITVGEANPSSTAWVNGDFVFHNERVEDIMKEVGRWYDIDVQYEQEGLKDIRLGGFVSRDKNISAVLRMMTLTKRVKFKVEGKTVFVQFTKL